MSIVLRGFIIVVSSYNIMPLSDETAASVPTFSYQPFHCSTGKNLGNTASEKLFAAESEEKSLNRLFLQIEVAEQYRDEAVDISDALCDLSQHYSATAALIREYSNLILDAEKKWQEIEQSDDFKAKYQSREEARMDFLKLYWKVEKP